VDEAEVELGVNDDIGGRESGTGKLEAGKLEGE
jgi:hypothetical protein